VQALPLEKVGSRVELEEVRVRLVTPASVPARLREQLRVEFSGSSS
jgi:hypothetical protein